MVLETIPLWQLWVFGGLSALFFIVGITVAIVVLVRMRWNWTVTILRDTPPYGNIPDRIKEKARLIAFGDGGEEIFYLKKLKKYRIGFGKLIGKNSVAWSVSQDGFWYNTGFGNLDKKLLEIGILPVERDMRFSNYTLREGLKNRFDDRTFIQKWGVPITIGILIIAILVQTAGAWFLLNKATPLVAGMAESTKVNKETMELAGRIIQNLDTLKSGGEGFVPA